MKGFYPLMMKRQNKLIIPLFLIAGLGIVGIVCAQGTAAETNKTEREKSAAYTRELASRLESSGFDIKGTVIDPDGALLNDVKMDIVLSSPIFPYMTDSKKINKVQNINSEFAVYEKGVTGIVLSFSKKGYYTEKVLQVLFFPFLKRDTIPKDALFHLVSLKKIRQRSCKNIVSRLR